MSRGNLVRQDLIYPELSFQLVGCAYDVFNELGPGHLEQVYQKAYAVALKNKKLQFKEQVYTTLTFQGEIIEKRYLDIEIEEKVIIELKKDKRFHKGNIEQVLNYIELKKLKLAILINFTKEGVVFKRIVNINHS